MRKSECHEVEGGLLGGIDTMWWAESRKSAMTGGWMRIRQMCDRTAGTAKERSGDTLDVCLELKGVQLLFVLPWQLSAPA